MLSNCRFQRRGDSFFEIADDSVFSIRGKQYLWKNVSFVKPLLQQRKALRYDIKKKQPRFNDQKSSQFR